jgi:exodeoxyribonuclease III
MRIATFNANSIRTRLPVLTEWLLKNEPDVLAVQETKVQDHEFPAASFSDIGYSAAFSGQKSYNGVALLSRKPMTDISAGFASDDEPSRIIRGNYDGITIINTYVPQGRDRDSEHYQYKLDWLGKMHSFLASRYRNDQPLIWLGDLNIAPEADDVHDPKGLDGHVCFNADLSALFRQICSWGLYDVFRKHHPEPQQYTFFDYRTFGAVSRKTGWRVDHILATKPLLDKSISSWIDLEPRKKRDPKPSDHTFLIADFQL